MSYRKIAIGGAIVVLLVTFAVLLTQTYTSFQGFNALGAIAAITVVIVGVAWFKKTAKP